MPASYSQEIKDTARKLFLYRDYSALEIKEELNLNNVRVVYQWMEKGDWESHKVDTSPEEACARKYVWLMDKPNKTDKEWKELDRYQKHMMTFSKLKTEKVKRQKMIEGEDGKPGNNKRRKKKNDVSEITAQQLQIIREDLFFEYQVTWHDAKVNRNRFILKSRQIGATFYFAFEAFEDAVITGDNQVFLSASKAQVMVFRAYILSFAQEHFELALKGNPILLSNGATLYFLSTNANTAQSYHGHLYIDEVFWMPDWDKIWKVASAMASQKKWRKTLFSTPSARSHPAYPLWTGDKWNKRRKAADKRDFDVGYEVTNDGGIYPDKFWRHAVNIEDAENQGCDLFDIDDLREEYPLDEFDNLFMCKFVDDGDSVFKLSDLLACGVDSSTWNDFNITQKRPFANRPVWMGYDPSRTRDSAVLSIVAPPTKTGGKLRLLEREIYNDLNFRFQKDRVKEYCDRYNVVWIGIDVTGIGAGLYDLVTEDRPDAVPIHYSQDNKNNLVVKAKDVISMRRLAFDANYKDIPQAFLQIRQTSTANGKTSYATNRNNETGHGDVAFSIMHAICNEPLNYNRQGNTASVKVA